MRKLIVSILSFIILCSNCLAYINQSNSEDLDISTKAEAYAETFRSMGTDNVFCIGNDIIHYFEKFDDDERDYAGISITDKLKSNSLLDEIKKRPNVTGVQIQYFHTPGVYRSPVAKSALDGIWYDGTIQWDTEQSKWIVESSQLFKEPTDDKRGEWVVNLRVKDDTTKPSFDKQSIGTATFRVHKPPVPRFTFTEGVGTATLSDNGSYDIDGSYKDLQGNYATDRGIKQWYWAAKVGDNWIDAGVGRTVTFNKNGLAVTDYRLTVEDWDGATATISKTSLILEKPIVDCEFRVGGHNGIITDYAYKGNAGHENLYVNSLVTYNDEAYDPLLYTTSGTRTIKWTALQTGDLRYGDSLFTSDVLIPKFSTLINGTSLPVEVEAKNRYDYFAVKKKTAIIKTVQTQDLTGTEGYVSDDGCLIKPCGFMVGTNALFIVNQTGSDVNNDEISMVASTAFGDVTLTKNRTNQFRGTLAMPDSPTYWDTISYTVTVYSKRTGELLHRVSGNIRVHTPLDLTGYVDGKTGNAGDINTDEPVVISATTTKYAKTVQAVIKTADTGTVIQTLNLTPNSDHTAWQSTTSFSGVDFADEKNMVVDFKAVAYNNRCTDTDSVTFKILPVKLYDFKITKITDPNSKLVVDTAIFTDGKLPVSQLAADEDNMLNGNIVRKGYSYYFQITSRGLKDVSDYIQIVPKFYKLNIDGSGNKTIGDELIGYIQDSHGDYKKFTTNTPDAIDVMLYYEGDKTHSLGTHSKIKIGSDLRTLSSAEQFWKARYGIPSTAEFVEVGQAISKNTVYKGEILITFNIEAYKNNIARYNYVGKNQWSRERIVPELNLDKKVYYDAENMWKAAGLNYGAVIVYDGTKSVQDAYDAKPVWMK